MRTRGEFSQVFQLGRSAADAHFVVYTRDNGRRWSRLGLSVGRRVGCAVRRNRIKRLLRETFRLSRDRIAPGLDILVVVRGRDRPDRFDEIQEALARLVARSARAKPRAHRERGAARAGRRKGGKK